MDVTAAGVDTWSPAWFVKRDSGVARAMRELATVPVKRGWILPDPVAGHVVGWMPDNGLVYAEGHPSLDDRQLGSPDDLPAILEHIEREMSDRGMGLPLGNARSTWHHVDDVPRDPGFLGVRRLDATVDLRFDSCAEGLTFLTGIAAVSREAPYIQAKVTFAPTGAQVQTVELKARGGRKTLGRAYDKGVERGVGDAGVWVRLEDQRRFVSNKRRTVEELGTAEVRELWRRRFAPFLAASEGVVVTTIERAAEDLLQRAFDPGDDTLDYRKAELLAGHLLLGRVADARHAKGAARATWYRRRKELRELGLVVADGVFDSVELDLHEAIEQALYADAWERRGCSLQLQLDVGGGERARQVPPSPGAAAGVATGPGGLAGLLISDN